MNRPDLPKQELIDAPQPPQTYFGTLALTGSAIKYAAFDYRQLPDGFYYAAPASISAAELANLAQQVEIGRELTEEWYTSQPEVLDDIDQAIEIGVRDSNSDELVGYGSLLVKKDNTAEIGDFFVSPPFQSRGIGKAIIDQRLLQADHLGVESTTIEPLAPTNTLETFYYERGFREQPNRHLMRWIHGIEFPPVTPPKAPPSQGFGAMSRASAISSLLAVKNLSHR